MKRNIDSPFKIVLYSYVLHTLAEAKLSNREALDPSLLHSIPYELQVISRDIEVKLTFNTWGHLGFFRGRDVPQTQYLDLTTIINYIRNLYIDNVVFTDERIYEDFEGKDFFSQICKLGLSSSMSGLRPPNIMLCNKIRS